MSNIRIPDSSLPETFNDGDYLTSDDLNQIVTVFKNAINYNKNDIDKMVASSEDAKIAYNIDTLVNFDGVEGEYSYLYNPDMLGDGIRLYEYVSGIWTYRTKLSLIDLYERIADVPEIEQLRVDMDTLTNIINNLVLGVSSSPIHIGQEAPPNPNIVYWGKITNR